MWRFSVCLVALLECALAIPGTCQDPPTLVEGPLPTAAQILTQHHISLTKDALLAALRNDDAEIRYLAAGQLADEHAQDAIPAIVEALKAEDMPQAKVNIAFALAQMGDERGMQALRQDCDATSLPMAYRLSAVLYLVLFLHDESCLRTVVEGYQQSPESGHRVQALSLIPDFKKLSANESALLRALLLSGLRDPDPGVRIEASDMLRTMGDVSAIPALEAAIAAETDVDVPHANGK